jgi:hypothetical protein
MDGHTYLVNEASAESAGWYEEKVAAVLLAEGVGWHAGDPESGEPLPAADGVGAAGTQDGEAGGELLDLGASDPTIPPSADNPDGVAVDPKE